MKVRGPSKHKSAAKTLITATVRTEKKEEEGEGFTV